jgi:hypothetical protein
MKTNLGSGCRSFGLSTTLLLVILAKVILQKLLELRFGEGYRKYEVLKVPEKISPSQIFVQINIDHFAM